MRRLQVSRLVGSMVAVLVALSASSLPLAHAHAHHRLHDERAHEHGHDPTESHAARAPLSDAAGTEIAATHESKDHAHSQASATVSARAELKWFVGPAPAPPLITQIELTDSVSLLLTAAPARAGPPDARPRQSRAPPLG